MRKAHSNVKFITDENDSETLIGVSLGYDYCAEHEWGTKGLNREFGIDASNKIGIDARSITKGKVIYKEKGDLALLRTDNDYKPLGEATFEECIPRDLEHRNPDKDVHTAWCENSFCVMGDKNKIKLLFDAFQNLNIAFAFISDMPAFGGTSLSILIKDKLPQDVLDNLAYVDQKAIDLTKYEEEIGIGKLRRDKFKSAYSQDFDKTKDKYWMALSPRWINYKNETPEDKESRNTKFDIMYWVNYGDNETYGWFTAEQIKEWLETPELKLKDFGGKKG